MTPPAYEAGMLDYIVSRYRLPYSRVRAGVATDCGLAGVRFQAGARISLLHNVQTGWGACLASYPIGTGVLYLGTKRPELGPRSVIVELYLFSPIRVHSVMINHRDSCTCYLQHASNLWAINERDVTNKPNFLPVPVIVFVNLLWYLSRHSHTVANNSRVSWTCHTERPHSASEWIAKQIAAFSCRIV